MATPLLTSGERYCPTCQTNTARHHEQIDHMTTYRRCDTCDTRTYPPVPNLDSDPHEHHSIEAHAFLTVTGNGLCRHCICGARSHTLPKQIGYGPWLMTINCPPLNY